MWQARGYQVNDNQSVDATPMDHSDMSPPSRRTFLALACDYDGTLAHQGRVSMSVTQALRRYRGTGGRLILVTGRETSDLCCVCSCLSLFDRVITENGAVMHEPASGLTKALTDPIPEKFVQSLRKQGVAPLGTGRVILATTRRWERTLLEAIRRQGLKLQLAYNKDSLMVLPVGIDKGSGLLAALGGLTVGPEDTVAIGDAENDESMLARAGLSVTVADALPALKSRVDRVTNGANGAGVEELIDWLLDERKGL
jgi:hydroxymethylpyrimidine pyrophosphatase-like HAD family hydrolase